MHPRQAATLAQANDLVARIAAKKQTEKKMSTPTLFKYTDPDSGQDFYLTEKKTTVKSPWSGKSISVKPEKFNMGDVTKELKSDAKAKLCLYLMSLFFWTPAPMTRLGMGLRTCLQLRPIRP